MYFFGLENDILLIDNFKNMKSLTIFVALKQYKVGKKKSLFCKKKIVLSQYKYSLPFKIFSKGLPSLFT